MSDMVGPVRHANGFYTPKPLSVNGHNGQDQNVDANQKIKEDIDIEAGYYLHRHKLGEGGFGKVRLATHLRTKEKVAIKCMEKTKLGEDLFRVQIEIKALKSLHHDNIAKLLQAIETPTHIYLVLEYCSGGELFDYLVAKSRLNETETRTIMTDLTNALAYLHSNGIAHRDLKPENILFDENHRIKLIDFGLAANCKNNTLALNYLSTCCGSPAYAAPELLKGNLYSGPEVDVWSAGVLLYALLVGKLPFDDENIRNLYKKIQTGSFDLPSWLSIEVRHLIANMLEKDPKKRITIKDILVHPWITNNGKIQVNNTLQIQKNNIDEETLWRCHLYFPDIPLNQLKFSIINGMGYHTATYWLLKMKPKQILQTPIKNDRRRLAKSETILEEPKDKAELGTKSVEVIEVKHKLGAKRKIEYEKNVDDKQNQFKSNIPENKYEEHNTNTTTTTTTTTKSPFSPTNLTRRLFNVNHEGLSPAKRGKTENLLPKTPPPVPPKKFRMSVLSPSKEVNVNVNKDEQQSMMTKQNDQFTTPLKKIEFTPKKSLLKRILESATPSKNHQPRLITTASTKNITSTTFTDPQECIDVLSKVLSDKGMICKQKEFTLRCSSQNNNLTFSLEICKFQDYCVIQRKRLRGDSWQYKKICEEILRIGNE